MTIKERDALFPGAVITGEMLPYLRLPDDIARYELVEGHIEPLTPTNRHHAEATIRIGALLVANLPGWRILGGDPGVYVRRRPDTVRAPDVAAISPERYEQNDPNSAFLTVVPELCVEIVSPSNKNEDVSRKAQEYIQAGGKMVWIVDVEERSVTIIDHQLVATFATGKDTLPLPDGAVVRAREVTG